MNQSVVAPAAGDGAKLPGPIEHLENNSRVIGQAAHNLHVDLDKTVKTPDAQATHDFLELFTFATVIENPEDRLRQCSQLGRGFFARLPLRLVDGLQNLRPLLGRNLFLPQKIRPEFTVADAHHQIFVGKSETAQDIDTKRHQFDVGLRGRFADDVAV